MLLEACAVWKKFGALDYKECKIDDAAPKYVTFTFAKMAKTKPTEDVWFSFITFKSKAHRNEVNKKSWLSSIKSTVTKWICRSTWKQLLLCQASKVEVGM
ncbi:DUF1428 family protein [bacterium]|nr:MAG: DUF1428 family protein [bacterium]